MKEMDEIEIRFLAREAEIDKRHANLPHWDQGETCVFATFRLADSLPQEKLSQWREERDAWLAVHPKPWSEIDAHEYYERFGDKPEQWLDDGLGSCVLANADASGIVRDALLHFDGERYVIHAFVVMPNHVHVLFSPQGEAPQGEAASRRLEEKATRRRFPLGEILHSWKSYTAKRIQKLVGGSGAFWQKESWDRLVRDEVHFRRVVRYIESNPVKARIDAPVYVRPGLSGGSATGGSGVSPLESTGGSGLLRQSRG